MCMCDSQMNDNKKDLKKERDEEMSKTLTSNVYKSLNLNPKKLKEITIKPKIKDGKLLFDRNNKDHQYIVEE